MIIHVAAISGMDIIGYHASWGNLINGNDSESRRVSGASVIASARFLSCEFDPVAAWMVKPITSKASIVKPNHGLTKVVSSSVVVIRSR